MHWLTMWQYQWLACMSVNGGKQTVMSEGSAMVMDEKSGDRCRWIDLFYHQLPFFKKKKSNNLHPQIPQIANKQITNLSTINLHLPVKKKSNPRLWKTSLSITSNKWQNTRKNQASQPYIQSTCRRSFWRHGLRWRKSRSS